MQIIPIRAKFMYASEIKATKHILRSEKFNNGSRRDLKKKKIQSARKRPNFHTEADADRPRGHRN
jgi:hypothetical protein